MQLPQPVLGVIIGNRDFFPDALVGEARADVLKLAQSEGFRPILLDPAESKLGGVETFADGHVAVAGRIGDHGLRRPRLAVIGGRSGVSGARVFADRVSARHNEPVCVPLELKLPIVGEDAFTLDRTMINLNNGGCSPAPRVVHEAFKRYLDHSNQAPSFYMWREVEPGIENARRGLAYDTGAEADTIAITRNASESLQIAQLGLDLKGGVHLVLRVKTDDALRVETESEMERIREALRTANISVTSVTAPSPTEFRVEGVGVIARGVVAAGHVGLYPPD